MIRSQLMTVIVSSVLDGTEMSHELVEQVNKQIGHPFLPGALDELVAVLREVNVDDTVIAAAEAARLPREPEEATIR